MALVYRHRRLDTNEIFYIGIGKNIKRAKDKWSRNSMWKRIVNKTNYSIEIIKNNLSNDEACELEMFLISEYGRRNLKQGNLSNMSDGGEFNPNRVISEETKLKISKSLKNRIFTKKHKLNLSKVNKGRKHSLKHIEKNRKQALKWHKNNIHGMSKPVICTKTLKEWSSAKLAYENNNLEMSYDSFKQRLNGRTKNSTSFKYKNNE